MKKPELPPAYDPKPWEEMTSAEKKAHAAMLREQARRAKPDPDDNSIEIMATLLAPTDGKPH